MSDDWKIERIINFMESLPRWVREQMYHDDVMFSVIQIHINANKFDKEEFMEHLAKFSCQVRRDTEKRNLELIHRIGPSELMKFHT